MQAAASGDIILHHADDTSHTMSWNIIHHVDEGVDPRFTVTVDIYDLQGDAVAQLTQEHAEAGEGDLAWDTDLPEESGVYAYRIGAEHEHPGIVVCGPEPDKSWRLETAVDKFYYCSKDVQAGTLQGVVKYTLNRAAGAVTIRFFEPELDEFQDSALTGQPTDAGSNWSDVYTLTGVEFDQNEEPVGPVYCVLFAEESAEDAAENRDGLAKPALEKGKSILAELLNLSAATLIDPPLAEHEEEDPGAFVHYNIDNDDESDNAVGGTKHPGSDLLQQEDPVTGEDDVLAATITFGPTIHWGKAALVRSGDAILVWTSATKGEDDALLVAEQEHVWELSVTEEYNEFHALKSSLFVEGAVYNGEADLKLEFRRPDDTVICEDAVHYTAIAADCGDQPITEERVIWDPHRQQHYTYKQSDGVSDDLVQCQWSITHNCVIDDDTLDYSYNCIAWSVDETTHWYNPQEIDEDFGDDDGVFEDTDMDAFYLAKKGWTRILDGSPEDRAGQAEAMYYGTYHAARRRSCTCGSDQWIMYESKCGALERIEHLWDQLSDAYDSPDVFYH